MKKVTILDIAKELNITFSTVARALNNHPAISEATKAAVRETAERLNYRRNNIASSLRSGKTFIVGIIVPSFNVTFFNSVVYGVERIMNENGYNILLYQSHESADHEKLGVETLLQSRVDGIIASIAKEAQDLQVYKDVLNRNIPLILFDRIVEEFEVPSVAINDYKGGFIATQHLIDQGFKKIIHITAEQDLYIFKERLRGYIDALEVNNIAVDQNLIIKGNFSLDFGRSVVRDIISRGINFDAIFALEDFTAMGAMQELQLNKIRIPQDVGIIGFANEAFGQLVKPGLSTIDQQTIKMGEEAARLFLKMSKKKKNIAEKIVLEPILIERASTLRNEISFGLSG